MTTAAPHTASTPHPASAALGRRRAFLNNKGGVGKTVFTVNLGLALAELRRRVLIVDMDPQGNCTRRLRATPSEHGSLAEVLERPAKGEAAAAIVPCGWDVPAAANVDVLPATLDLADRDGEAANPGSHARLHRALHGVDASYDYILFDCRPTLGHLEQMVVAALDGPDDGIYVPVEPGHDAISGASRVIKVVAGWAEQLGIEGNPVLGVMVNMVDSRTRLHAGRLHHLPASLPGNDVPVLQPYIPRAIRIAETADTASPVGRNDQRMTREGLAERFTELATVVDTAL